MTKPTDPLSELDKEAPTVDLDELIAIDGIFGEPIGPAPTVSTPSRAKRDEGVVPMLGLSRQQERAAAAGTGAVAGPIVRRSAQAVFPGGEARTAEAARRLQDEQKLSRLMQNLREEELLRLGIKPEAPAPAAQTSGTKWVRNWAGMDREIAGGVPEGAAAYQRTKPQGKVSSKLAKKFGPLEPGQSLIDKLMQQSVANEAAAATRTEAEAAAEAAAKARFAAARPGPLTKLARVASSTPVAGATSGLSFYDAYRRFMEGDRTGAVIAALGGVAGIAALLGGGMPALGLSLATIPAGMAYDAYKERAERENTPPEYPRPTPVAP